LQKQILYQGYWKYRPEHYEMSASESEPTYEETIENSRPVKFLQDFDRALEDVRQHKTPLDLKW
jgi:hypothetical protein